MISLEVNIKSMLPVGEVIVSGRVFPVNTPNKGSEGVAPPYTQTWSFPFSRSKVVKARLRARVPVQLDRPREVYFDNLALWHLEKETGKPWQEMLAPTKDGKNPKFGFRELVALLWAGLLHCEPNATILDVAALTLKAKGPDPAAKFMLLQSVVMEAFMAATESLLDEDTKKKLLEARDNIPGPGKGPKLLDSESSDGPGNDSGDPPPES